jgi:hypothetical protein
MKCCGTCKFSRLNKNPQLQYVKIRCVKEIDIPHSMRGLSGRFTRIEMYTHEGHTRLCYERKD